MVAWISSKVKEYNALSNEVPRVVHLVLGGLSALYFVFFVLLSLWRDIPLPPDLILLLMLFLVYLWKRTPSLIRTVPLPILILAISYRLTTSIAGEAAHIHVSDIIDYELAMFPFVPTIKLQSLLFSVGRFRWYDGLTAMVYFLQLPLTFLMGFYLFVSKRVRLFQQYLLSLFLLSYIGYVTYLLFPAMPPWLAAQEGYLPRVHRILLDFYDSIGMSFVNVLYGSINNHPVSAVPSLHMGNTLLPMLYVARIHKWKGKVFAFSLCLLMFFTIVYLGEHFVFDAVIGALYALGAYALGNKLYDVIDAWRTRAAHESKAVGRF